jgi:hypothetical protein
MPKNPQRDYYGGDVSGTEKISNDGAVNVPSTFEVATASYDPGYLGVDEALPNTKRAGYVTDADIKRGYTSYGEPVGESSKNWSKIR